MSFRNQSKQNKGDRFAQMSAQEVIIERKKREIQERIEAQKRKETEEALKKTEPPSAMSKLQRKNAQMKYQDVRVPVANVFSNDGSFLDQFKKLSNSGLKPDKVDVKTIAKVREIEEEEKARILRVEKEKVERDKERQIELKRREKERFERHRLRDLAEKEQQQLKDRPLSPNRKLQSSNIQLQLPPPGIVQLVPQHQVQLIPPQLVLTSAQTIPVLPTSNTVPLTSNTVQILQSNPVGNTVQILQTPSPVPPPTASVQLISSSVQILQPPPNSVQIVPNPTSIQLVPPAGNTVQLVQPFVPTNPQLVPLPNSPYPTNSVQLQPPPSSTATYNFCPPVLPTASLVEPNPPPPPLPPVDQIPPPLPMSPQKIPPPQPLQVHNIPPPPLGTDRGEVKGRILEEIPLPEDKDEVCRLTDETMEQVAKMVARQGDAAEDLIRIGNTDDPAFRFLLDKAAPEYKTYRLRVNDLRARGDFDDEEKYTTSDNDTQSFISDEGYKPESPTSPDPEKEIKDENIEIDDNQERNVLIGQENVDHNGWQLSAVAAASNATITSSYLPPIPTESQTEDRRKRKRKSRWGDASSTTQASVANIPMPGVVTPSAIGMQPAKIEVTGNINPPLLSKLTRTDPGLLMYARQAFGSLNLSEEDWKKAEDHYKINLLYQDMAKKKAELERLQEKGKFKYEYDSDEETDGGTWEHKLRQQEMHATQLWADELTRQAEGKHHIGDFLPPEELKRFLENYNAAKEGREPDLSDYKEFKLKEDNVGFQLLQKMGWNEGQGLGQDGSGIKDPINKSQSRFENVGLGVERPDSANAGDDEYDAYRKRMMLAYRFRPNPLNNPRRPYY